jgi:uncharacterized membrane protein
MKGKKKNMTFSEQFKEIFELICDKIGIAIDWTQENIIPYVMDLCKRYVAYNIVETILWILFGIALIIGVITFFICFFGLKLGKKFGTVFSNKATIIGGIILIVIGFEIFITGVFYEYDYMPDLLVGRLLLIKSL